MSNEMSLNQLHTETSCRTVNIKVKSSCAKQGTTINLKGEVEAVDKAAGDAQKEAGDAQEEAGEAKEEAGEVKEEGGEAKDDAGEVKDEAGEVNEELEGAVGGADAVEVPIEERIAKLLDAVLQKRMMYPEVNRKVVLPPTPSWEPMKDKWSHCTEGFTAKSDMVLKETRQKVKELSAEVEVLVNTINDKLEKQKKREDEEPQE